MRSEGTQRGDTLWKNSRDAQHAGVDFQIITTWRVLECSTCHQPTLVQEVVEYSHDCVYEPEVTAAETAVLYPKTAKKLVLADLPPKIAEEYEAAIQVQNISFNACAVLLRRTLEAIFNHEKAQGKTLEQKVDYLLKSANIPPLLAEMAHLGRHIRNLGAHVDANEVTEEDVTVLLNFIEVIFVYLYTTPTKVVAFKEKQKKDPLESLLSTLGANRLLPLQKENSGVRNFPLADTYKRPVSPQSGQEATEFCNLQPSACATGQRNLAGSSALIARGARLRTISAMIQLILAAFRCFVMVTGSEMDKRANCNRQTGVTVLLKDWRGPRLVHQRSPGTKTGPLGGV